ncbi:MAG: hypothetical protein ACKVOE_10935 [Rickettsiales bacterium]
MKRYNRWGIPEPEHRIGTHGISRRNVRRPQEEIAVDSGFLERAYPGEVSPEVREMFDETAMPPISHQHGTYWVGQETGRHREEPANREDWLADAIDRKKGQKSAVDSIMREVEPRHR